MTRHEPDTKTKEHEPWEGNDIPAQEYLSRLRTGMGTNRLNAEATTYDDRPTVGVTLPPWLYDEIDWDDEGRYEGSGTEYGHLVLGPRAPPGASYGVKNACQAKQVKLDVRRESTNIDAERMREEFNIVKDRAHDTLQDILYLKDNEDTHDPEHKTVKEAARELKEVEKIAHDLRLWLYEEYGEVA